MLAAPGFLLWAGQQFCFIPWVDNIFDVVAQRGATNTGSARVANSLATPLHERSHLSASAYKYLELLIIAQRQRGGTTCELDINIESRHAIKQICIVEQL